jgi:hypothetical protein
VARAEGALVAYLPGLAMRHIGDLHAGEAKTDARDAYIIAGAAHSLLPTLRSLKLTDKQVAELTMLCGFDVALAGRSPRSILLWSACWVRPLARRRCDVLFAMLRDSTLYSPPKPATSLT